jgi:hypothetical protein
MRVATQGRDPKLTAAQVMRDGAVTVIVPALSPVVVRYKSSFVPVQVTKRI